MSGKSPLEQSVYYLELEPLHLQQLSQIMSTLSTSTMQVTSVLLLVSDPEEGLHRWLSPDTVPSQGSRLCSHHLCLLLCTAQMCLLARFYLHNTEFLSVKTNLRLGYHKYGWQWDHVWCRFLYQLSFLVMPRMRWEQNTVSYILGATQSARHT